jgi:hypothetical protein
VVFAARTLVRTTLLVAGAVALAANAPSLGSCDRAALVSRFNATRGDPYPLDDVDRTLPTDGGVICPEVELMTFRGERVRFAPAVRVIEPFAERLRRFEAALSEVSLRHYGRAPRVVVNEGAYSCRAVRHRAYRLSEHALGNAIDVVGFDFGPLDAHTEVEGGTLGVPAALRGVLRVRIENHWKAGSGEAAAVHARFLDELVTVLAEREVFRSILGPSHPTHRTHLHLDMAPWKYVNP